jgi:transcriptional regulator with XRE-family HTH domain
MMAFRHMTQAELASSVGITQGMVSQYIHGYSSPSFRVVDRMAKALGCSADDLRLLY